MDKEQVEYLNFIDWEGLQKPKRRVQEDCLNLSEVVDEMKVTKQYFKTMKCGHRKSSEYQNKTVTICHELTVPPISCPGPFSTIDC